MKKARSLAVLGLVCQLVFAAPSHAYLDPAAGSLMLQVLLGGIAGLVVVLKLFWHRILHLLGLRRRPANND